MNTEIKAVHFSMNEQDRQYIEKKLGRLHNAENTIINLAITLHKDASEFIAEATVHFRWGVSAHIKEHDVELTRAADRLIDALSIKVTKEKEKVQEKRP